MELLDMKTRTRLIDKWDSLTPMEQSVATIRFGLDGNGPRTLEEVGREFGITRERCRQIEARILSMVRHPAR